MKLLIITQKVDRQDPILGFFHRWLEEFARHCQQLTVIALGVGEYDLPSNVKILSLGKPAQGWSASGRVMMGQKILSLFRFYCYLWQERKNYQTVFVHMNQEYALLGGLFWRLWGKKVTLWRNHHAGNWLTNLVVGLCQRVFCTSRYSYTAQFNKTVLMPVGIDLDVFKRDSHSVNSKEGSILFLARLSPVKKPNVLLSALFCLSRQGVAFKADFYGDHLASDHHWAENLKSQAKELESSGQVKFWGGVPNRETPSIYQQHEIFVNLSSSGMYDKTIFEAMACGCLVLVCNQNLVGEIDERLIFKEDDASDLSLKLQTLLALPSAEKNELRDKLEKYVIERHSLRALVQKLKDNFDELI